MRDRNLERDIAYIKDMLLYIERAREVIPRAICKLCSMTSILSLFVI